MTGLLVSVTTVLCSKLRKPQHGQATAEYALVLLAVAAVALALTTWAAGGKIASFLDTIFDKLVATAK